MYEHNQTEVNPHWLPVKYWNTNQPIRASIYVAAISRQPHGPVLDASVSSLNCCLLNVCGLKSKLLGPDNNILKNLIW